MSVSKQEDILKQLVSEITRGKLGSSGATFPTVRSLSESFGASPVTIQRVVHRLTDMGLIVRSGRGMKLAQNIKKKMRRIGAIVTQLDNPFYSRLLNEFEREGEKRGIDVLSAGCANNPARCSQIIKIFEENNAEAIFLCTSKADEQTLECKLPIVCIGTRSLSQNYPVVEVDHIRAGEMAAFHLILQGCRDFFYVTGTDAPTDERKIGFISCLEQYGFKLPADHILSVNPASEEPFDENFFNFFKKNLKVRPAGVFCFHDLWAMRVLRSAHFHSLAIPEDLAVVGFDNLPICSETLPPLSSIAYPLRKLAEGAYDILNDIRSGKNVGSRRILLEPQLVIRQSSSIKKG